MVSPRPSSIIERMAEGFYASWKKDGKVVILWSDLSQDDRQRFVDAMLEAVVAVPNFLELKSGEKTLKLKLYTGREALIAEHQSSQQEHQQ